MINIRNVSGGTRGWHYAILFGFAAMILAPQNAEARCEFPCFSNDDSASSFFFNRTKQAKRHSRRSHGKSQKRKYFPVLRRVKPRGLPLNLANAVVTVESAWRPNAKGTSGERGLMQLMRGTARIWAPMHIRHLRGSRFTRAIKHPTTNLRIGTRYLHWCYRRAKRNVPATIGCYNRGPGKMWKWNKNRITRLYVRKVRRLMRRRV